MSASIKLFTGRISPFTSEIPKVSIQIILQQKQRASPIGIFNSIKPSMTVCRLLTIGLAVRVPSGELDFV
jgi:hypothetical protein